jgi:radical SAM superfamily enzyme YgiQ (UPF0313 family)
MSRGVTTEEIRQMTRLAQRYGIQVGLFVMFGYEGETEEDILATIEHLKQVNADTFLTTVAYPIKGTEYYADVESRIVTALPWNQRTERQLDVRGRPTKSYYWFAQRLMTNEVLLHQLSKNGQRQFPRRAVALTKAAIARVGMHLTRRWTT